MRGRPALALVFFLLYSLACTAADDPPKTLSELPLGAQAKIRDAMSRNMPSLPPGSQPRQDNVAMEGPWAQLAQPVPTDGPFSRYGISVAINGDTVVVGQLYTFRGIGNGEALVFVKPKNGDWNNLTQSAVLVASDGLQTDLFGSSVAIEGKTIVVGDPPYSGCTCGAGRAYVYIEPPGGWSGTLTQTAELTTSNGLENAGLGTSVSISGGTVVAGAPGQGSGAAYVFVRPATGWVDMTQTAELTSSDGLANEQLGASVSISANTIVAGAPQAIGISTSRAGAAYVFVEPAGGWINMTQTARLFASEATPFEAFGQSVAISGGTVTVGAPRASGLNAATGAAYVFVEPLGGWKNSVPTAEFVAPDGETGDAFGSAVAIEGNTILVGAPYRVCRAIPALGYPAGAAYVFTKSGLGWDQTSVQILTGSDAHNADLLGAAVAISGDFAVTGAPYLQKYSGAAFIFAKL